MSAQTIGRSPMRAKPHILERLKVLDPETRKTAELRYLKQMRPEVIGRQLGERAAVIRRRLRDIDVALIQSDGDYRFQIGESVWWDDGQIYTVDQRMRVYCDIAYGSFRNCELRNYYRLVRYEVDGTPFFKIVSESEIFVEKSGACHV